MPYNGVMADLGNPLYCQFSRSGWFGPRTNHSRLRSAESVSGFVTFCKGPVAFGVDRLWLFLPLYTEPQLKEGFSHGK